MPHFSADNPARTGCLKLVHNRKKMINIAQVKYHIVSDSSADSSANSLADLLLFFICQ
jgi:hypothetical protein